MKKIQLTFDAQQLTKEQMKQVTGGKFCAANIGCYVDDSCTEFLGFVYTSINEQDCDDIDGSTYYFCASVYSGYPCTCYCD